MRFIMEYSFPCSVLFFQVMLAGFAEFGPFFKFHVAIGAVTFVPMRMLVFIFSLELNNRFSGLSGFVVLDGHLEGIRTQIAAMEFVFGQTLESIGDIFIGDPFGLFKSFSFGDLGQHA
jgi:hypothetical protein